jgi:thiol-disulfide isomerase/thioredoxin
MRQKDLFKFNFLGFMTMKKLAILAVLAIVVCATALAGTMSRAQQVQQPAVQASTSMSDIDKALANGPVFIEFEMVGCHYCAQQHPISAQLQSDYAGKVTFFFLDANENRDLASTFQVTGVPQMDIIVSKSGNTYTYMGPNGKSDSISSSRFLGLTQKDDLKTALDAALQARM